MGKKNGKPKPLIDQYHEWEESWRVKFEREGIKFGVPVAAGTKAAVLLQQRDDEQATWLRHFSGTPKSEIVALIEDLEAEITAARVHRNPKAAEMRRGLEGIRLQLEELIATRKPNGNAAKESEELKLPDTGWPLDLWKSLRDGQGKGKTDRQIARDYHPQKGEGILRQLIASRTRGKISDWKNR